MSQVQVSALVREVKEIDSSRTDVLEAFKVLGRRCAEAEAARDHLRKGGRRSVLGAAKDEGVHTKGGAMFARMAQKAAAEEAAAALESASSANLSVVAAEFRIMEQVGRRPGEGCGTGKKGGERGRRGE